MDKFSYALGLGIGQQLKQMGLKGKLVINDFAASITDVLEDNDLKVSHQEGQQIVNAFFRELEQKQNAAKAEAGKAAKEEGAKFSNRLDFFIERTKEYNPSGRNQTFEEAKEIDRRIRELNPNMQSITGDVDGYTVALNKILDTVRPNVASPSMGVANPWGIKIQIIHNK